MEDGPFGRSISSVTGPPLLAESVSSVRSSTNKGERCWTGESFSCFKTVVAAVRVSVLSSCTDECFVTGAAFGALHRCAPFLGGTLFATRGLPRGLAAVAMVGGTWTTEGVPQVRSVCESVGRASGTNGLLTRLPAVVRVEVRAIVTVWKGGVDVRWVMK